MPSASAVAPPPRLRHLRRCLFLFLAFTAFPIFNATSQFSMQVARTAAAGESNAAENPFTPKGYVLRYWRKQISNNLPKPEFLLDKASPLTAADYAAFSKLAADQNSLSIHLPEFCSKANLLCFPDSSPSLQKHNKDVNFVNYVNKKFNNYGKNRVAGADTFRRYENDDIDVFVDIFRSYSRQSTDHDDEFDSYTTNSAVLGQSFNTYGASAISGDGQFTNYNWKVTVQDLRFTSYSDRGTGREQSFTTYAEEANGGDQRFTSYGKNGNATEDTFTSYGNESNAISTSFNNYGETGIGAHDTFTSYGTDGNAPGNNFTNYGAGGDQGSETFANYRDRANVGDDSFDSYGNKSTAGKMGFSNYGQSFNLGTDKFTSYGRDAAGQVTDFKIYGVYFNTTFKEYTKQGTTFSTYINETSSSSSLHASMATSGRTVNKWVEPGKFFRESMLKPGTIMPMPDIRDKMPKRSFLPRLIVSKLPFSTSKIAEIKKIFHAGEDNDSGMSKMVTDALKECERPPSPGETKRCVASIEDMIDFATAVLGRSVVARTTATTDGSNGQIIIGEVKGINGGNMTQSVSCHQSLYPYLLYYCHSVPNIRVYETDILDPNTKSKINHGVAICHVDTSSWSPNHGAFIVLGSGPGKIEVCHWIFENDLTWAVAD